MFFYLNHLSFKFIFFIIMNFTGSVKVTIRYNFLIELLQSVTYKHQHKVVIFKHPFESIYLATLLNWQCAIDIYVYMYIYTILIFIACFNVYWNNHFIRYIQRKLPQILFFLNITIIIFEVTFDTVGVIPFIVICRDIFWNRRATCM